MGLQPVPAPSRPTRPAATAAPSAGAVAFAIVLAIAFPTGPAAATEGAFEAPRYLEAPFAAEGVFLEDPERREIVQALAALASRFAEIVKVDGDLRRKALGLALALDPFDATARAAFRALAQEAPVPEIPAYGSLSAVSEALWIAAGKLRRPPLEPEAAALAPFLMELSLLAHPEPPRDRLAAFGSETEGAPLPWEGFVALDPEGSASTRRAAELAARSLAAATEPAPPSGRAHAPAAERPSETSEAREERRERRALERAAAGEEEGGTMAWEETRVLALPAVLPVAAVEGGAILGEFTLAIREPESFADVEPFPFLDHSAPAEYPFLPILARGEDGVPLERLQIPGDFALVRGWAWPRGWIGEAAYRTGASLPGPRRLSRVSGLLPASLLLEAAFTDRVPNPDFLVAGEIDPLPAGRLRVPGDPGAMVEAASESGHRYLLLPGGLLEDLVAYLQRSGRLENLFAPEWIAAERWDEIVPLVLDETPPALGRASEIFAEIEAVSNRTPLSELAKNERVQERLLEILEIFPRHLSAQAMLEYGIRPTPPEVAFAAVFDKIDTLLEPLERLRLADGPIGGLRGELEGIKAGLFQLRPEVPAEARDYFSKAEGVYEAAERFLSLNNPHSSIGEQRRRELAEAFGRLEGMRRAGP